MTDALLADARGGFGGAVLDACAEHVNCRFCGKQFLRRHQKLLMLHIEQKHVDDLRRLLDIRLPATAAAEAAAASGRPHHARCPASRRRKPRSAARPSGQK